MDLHLKGDVGSRPGDVGPRLKVLVTIGLIWNVNIEW